MLYPSIQSQLSEFCDKTNIDEFTVRPNLFFQGIFKIIFPFGLLAYFLNFLVYPYSIFASIAMIVFYFFLITDFMYLKGLLGPFFKKGTSSNVYGVIKPKKEVKIRVVLDGHTDSPYELPWARVKKLSIVAFIGSGAVFYILIQLIYPIIKIIKQSLVFDHDVIFNWTIFEIAKTDRYMLPICFVLMIFFSTLFLGLFSNRKVMGANDNLSGTAVAITAGKYFAKNKLDHTELVVISTGSEEIGERGAHYFAKNHPELLENAYVLVFECVGAGKNLFIVERDYMHMAFYSKEVVTLVKKAYEIYNKDENNKENKGGYGKDMFLGNEVIILKIKFLHLTDEVNRS